MAAFPPSVTAGVEAALSSRARQVIIRSATPVGGGCINRGARLQTDDGSAYFLKWNASAPPGLFSAEWDGLAALGASSSIRVPEPVAMSAEGDSPAWLLMEYLSPGRPAPDFDARLGLGLAQLHCSAEGGSFGWHQDNWIGSLPQDNTPRPSWAEFWRDRRLVPQLEGALHRGHFRGRGRGELERLIDRVPSALSGIGEERCHLLHGDLWNGNVFASGDGRPTLIDPAVYRGHGEVDLAMSELFGGFGGGFFAAYDEVITIPREYHTFRRALYQLFYLLVHVNLFGASYEAGSVAAARRVNEELGS
jgi:fructosamine-3-kinase